MKKRILKVIITGLIITSFLAISVMFLDVIGYECFYRHFFKIYCAGCGVTRMVKALLKGQFVKAFKYNQIFFILSFVLFFYLIYAIIVYIKNGKIISPSVKAVVFVGVLLFVFMILRNIPYFDFLRPID